MVTLDIDELERMTKQLKRLKNVLFSAISDIELHQARMKVLFQIDDISGVIQEKGFPDMTPPGNLYNMGDYRP